MAGERREGRSAGLRQATVETQGSELGPKGLVTEGFWYQEKENADRGGAPGHPIR